MTELLEQAVKTARGLPSQMQDEIARIMLMIAAEDQPTYEMSPAEEASFAKSRAQASRGEFATEEQVRAIWSKHNL